MSKSFTNGVGRQPSPTPSGREQPFATFKATENDKRFGTKKENGALAKIGDLMLRQHGNALGVIHIFRTKGSNFPPAWLR
jgi:hypothetical protein